MEADLKPHFATHNYLGIGPRDDHAREEEAVQGPGDDGADERDDVIDGAKFPRQEADADGNQAGQAGCRREGEQCAIYLSLSPHG